MGWKMTGDREDFDKEVSKEGLMPEPVALCGAALAKDFNPFQGPGVPLSHAGLTRHHIIPHHLLIAVWNTAVDRGHFTMLKSLVIWAGQDPTVVLPGVLDPSDPNPAPDPQKALMRVAWNPWNIAIGPKMEHRIGDPGDSFDRLKFRELGSFKASDGPIEKNDAWQESLARQEFNTHVERLHRIYRYMVRYVGDALPLAEIEVESLMTLLRSDRPSQYGRLNDGKKSLIRFGGAVLSPALWGQFSFKVLETYGAPAEPAEIKQYWLEHAQIENNQKMPAHIQKQRLQALPERNFAALAKETKILNNTVQWGVVAWSSVSYLPKPELPELRFGTMDLWEPGQAQLPNPRYLLSRATYTNEVAKTFRAEVTRAARRAGRFKADVKIVGPRGVAGAMHPHHDDVVKATVEALTALHAEGYRFKIARTFLDASALEVRFYSESTA